MFWRCRVTAFAFGGMIGLTASVARAQTLYPQAPQRQIEENQRLMVQPDLQQHDLRLDQVQQIQNQQAEQQRQIADQQQMLQEQTRQALVLRQLAEQEREQAQARKPAPEPSVEPQTPAPPQPEKASPPPEKESPQPAQPQVVQPQAPEQQGGRAEVDVPPPVGTAVAQQHWSIQNISERARIGFGAFGLVFAALVIGWGRLRK